MRKIVPHARPQRPEPRHGLESDRRKGSAKARSGLGWYVGLGGFGRGEARPTVNMKPTRSTPAMLPQGDVPAGWTPRGWLVELRRKADRCRRDHPDTADAYRKWAAAIEATLPPPFPARLLALIQEQRHADGLAERR